MGQLPSVIGASCIKAKSELTTSNWPPALSFHSLLPAGVNAKCLLSAVIACARARRLVPAGGGVQAVMFDGHRAPTAAGCVPGKSGQLTVNPDLASDPE